MSGPEALLVAAVSGFDFHDNLLKNKCIFPTPEAIMIQKSARARHALVLLRPPHLRCGIVALTPGDFGAAEVKFVSSAAGGGDGAS